MAVVWRGVWVFGVCWMAAFAYLARRLRAGRLSESQRERLRGEVLTDTLQRLGATYTKLGQILGSRPDLLSPGMIKALSRLQDRVAVTPFERMRAVLLQDLGERELANLTIDPEPVASASVAQVYRAQDGAGRELALKVQRPTARQQIERDLSLMILGARLLDKVPSLRLLSLPGTVREFGTSLRGQLDFRHEADNNRRFARAFAAWPDVRLPELVDALCTERVLVMEFVHGVKASEPEKVGGDRTKLAQLGAETVLKMIFDDGFVHADLHPGNVMLTSDSRVVLLDVGMVAHISGDLVRPFIETNFALAQGNARVAARLFYVFAPSVGTRDYARYERDVVEHFDRYYGKTIQDVEVSVVVGGIMNILRRHRVQVDPAFTVVHVSMLVAEGLGKQLDPNLDMLKLAMPYLQKALAKAPPGRAPLREVPTPRVDCESLGAA